MAFTKLFGRCSCFFKSNIYLEDYRLHVHFENHDQFLNDYKSILEQKSRDVNIDYVLKTIYAEIERRKHIDHDASLRKDIIVKQYKPLYPDLYTFKAEYLSDDFIELCKNLNEPRNTWNKSFVELNDKIYTLPIFTSDFCSRFIDELKHFENTNLPKGRPNSMNNYGILLDEIGFNNFIDELRINYLNEFARLLYGKDYVGSSGLDSHKAFVVTYKIGHDVDLGYHYDNAEVTLNISLGGNFEGGSLYFGPLANIDRVSDPNFTCVEHKPTYGVFHRSIQLHGVEPIESGQRYNLIIWMRSSSIRNQLCPMCWQKPNILPVVSGYGDGMTV